MRCPFRALKRNRGLSEDGVDWVHVFHAGQALIEPLEFLRKPAVVDPHALEDGGIDGVEVDWVFDDVVGEVVGGTVHDASFDAAAGHPHAEVARVVIASVGFAGQRALGVDGAAEFTAPDDEGVLEQAAAFEIDDEGGGCLVCVFTLIAERGREVVVLIPATMEDLHGAHAAFEHAACEQRAVRE